MFPIHFLLTARSLMPAPSSHSFTNRFVAILMLLALTVSMGSANSSFINAECIASECGPDSSGEQEGEPLPVHHASSRCCMTPLDSEEEPENDTGIIIFCFSDSVQSPSFIDHSSTSFCPCSSYVPRWVDHQKRPPRTL